MFAVADHLDGADMGIAWIVKIGFFVVIILTILCDREK